MGLYELTRESCRGPARVPVSRVTMLSGRDISLDVIMTSDTMLFAGYRMDILVDSANPGVQGLLKTFPV